MVCVDVGTSGEEQALDVRRAGISRCVSRQGGVAGGTGTRSKTLGDLLPTTAAVVVFAFNF